MSDFWTSNSSNGFQCIVPSSVPFPSRTWEISSATKVIQYEHFLYFSLQILFSIIHYFEGIVKRGNVIVFGGRPTWGLSQKINFGNLLLKESRSQQQPKKPYNKI